MAQYPPLETQQKPVHRESAAVESILLPAYVEARDAHEDLAFTLIERLRAEVVSERELRREARRDLTRAESTIAKLREQLRARRGRR